MLPVTIKLPVICADPVYGKDEPVPPPAGTTIGNVEPSPLVNVIVLPDIDAVVSRDAVGVAAPLPVFTVIGNVEPSPLVNVIVFNDTDAVVNNDPVLVVPPLPVLTVTANVDPLPFVKVITFNAADAVVNKDPVSTAPPAPAFNAYDAVKAYDDDITLFEPYGPNTPLAVMNEAVCAKLTYDAVDAFNAYDELNEFAA